jgi:hypothetical protein
VFIGLYFSIFSPKGCLAVAAVNLPLIGRRFLLHRKAHGQEGAVRGLSPESPVPIRTETRDPPPQKRPET